MVEIKEYENGFKYIEVVNATSNAKIALQGAHIFEHKRQGCDDVLWLSETSAFEEGVAIRGGIPICWPRFGTLDKTLPAHGFSRTTMFELGDVLELDESTSQVTLLLEDSEETREIWNHSFRLEVVFTISNSLTVEMKTTNKDREEFMITQALHTYFDISHIDDVKIEGLENKPYLDTLRDKKHIQDEEFIINAECDRVYQEVDKDIVLKDKNRALVLNAMGSSSAVVWNPWIEKGSRMSGMRADAYKEFVCIETANAFDDFIIIKPSESHSLKVTLS